MVRISAIVGLLVTMAMGVQAGLYCQCLKPDGSHCCIADNNGGCTQSCMNVAPIFENDNPCNAGGKYSDVSAWNAQWRTACND
ncbi:hypothetical protein DDE82_004589 [Stemphylium lycopersici]|uniref:Uncharacterized protein n=1 Tax=Stemphylium lycopersici TaxID=183478 RepID=A0A364N349_STELY|nr:hypothetical protein TW65_02950 [Stemphylium lycopersici]RAR04384.1 hypothetical protein DDE82_004589 [Stemphylium lycopersici]RAR10781.1 hypothetical protein DDE83_004925 [Stemphylium lycopersici]